MRLYVDEDIASKELISRLRAAGNEVLEPLLGEPDSRCWSYAQDHAATVLTMNARDFVALTQDADHHGLLLVYRDNDPSRDMTFAAMVDAVSHVVEAYPRGVANQILSLNQFRRLSSS